VRNARVGGVVPVLALMYHEVEGDPDTSRFRGPAATRYNVSPARFERHLDAIEASGHRPGLVGEQDMGTRLLLTFDEGGRAAATYTAPILERRGWRGHFFITTDRFDTEGFLARAQVSALHEAGHLVGSHGSTHRAQTDLDDDDVRREWSESKAVLEDLLGTSVTVASVPRGRYSTRIGRLAIEAGYDHVFTSEPWLEPRSLASGLVYGRIPVVSNMSPERIAALCAFSRPTLWWLQSAWYSRKAAKSLLGPVYDRVRRSILDRTH
jgi:peptidoglycan/xylan/chitin deacetylase (PgdA/CDA1 family)